MQSLTKFKGLAQDNKTVTIQQQENGFYLAEIIDGKTIESVVTTDTVDKVMIFFYLHGVTEIKWKDDITGKIKISEKQKHENI